MGEALNNAGTVGRDFDIDFVGFKLGNGFAGRDSIADSLHIAQNSGFSDGLSHLRDTDLSGHGQGRSFSILRRLGPAPEFR